MLNREQTRKNCANMGKRGNFGRVQWPHTSGRPSAICLSYFVKDVVPKNMNLIPLVSGLDFLSQLLQNTRIYERKSYLLVTICDAQKHHMWERRKEALASLSIECFTWRHSGKGTPAMLMSPINLAGIELYSCGNVFFCFVGKKHVHWSRE